MWRAGFCHLLCFAFYLHHMWITPPSFFPMHTEMRSCFSDCFQLAEGLSVRVNCCVYLMRPHLYSCSFVSPAQTWRPCTSCCFRVNGISVVSSRVIWLHKQKNHFFSWCILTNFLCHRVLLFCLLVSRFDTNRNACCVRNSKRRNRQDMFQMRQRKERQSSKKRKEARQE